MAQLVKLKDFLSRYERDPQYYSSEFPRLKKQFWQATCTRWVERDRAEPRIFDDAFIEPEEGIFKKIKSKFNPFQWRKGKLDFEEEIEEQTAYMISDEILQSIEEEKDLKQIYLDELLKIQLRWVSADETNYTARMMKKYQYDERLKFFVQRFPDQYFYLHDPIFKIRKAPVELSPILIGPTGIYCISYMERREESVLIGSGEKFWVEKYGDQESKVLNPLFHLQRSAKIVRTLVHDEHFPIYKIILCPFSYVNYDDTPTDTQVVDKRVYEEWLDKMRSSHSPVKFTQLCVLQDLLANTAIRKGKHILAEVSGEESQEKTVHTHGLHGIHPLHDLMEKLHVKDEEDSDAMVLNYAEMKKLEQLIEKKELDETAENK